MAKLPSQPRTDAQFGAVYDRAKLNRLVEDLQRSQQNIANLIAQVAAIQAAGPATTVPEHELAGESGLGPSHTVTGLTPGQVLRAASGVSARFQFLAYADMADTDVQSFESPAAGSVIQFVDGYWTAAPNDGGLGVAAPGRDSVLMYNVAASSFAWASPGNGIAIGPGAISVVPAQITHGALAGLLADDHPQYGLLGSPNTWEGLQTLSGGFSSAADSSLEGSFAQSDAEPSSSLTNTDDAADEGAWQVQANPGMLEDSTLNDDGSVGETWLQVVRDGELVEQINLQGAELTFNGDDVVTGAENLNGAGGVGQIFAGQDGGLLKFAGLIAGTNLTITTVADGLRLDASGGGAPGAQGVPGVAAEDGEDGDFGPPGAAGAPGSAGVPGPAGPAGAPGAAGLPGSQGVLLLFEGESGEDGSPGAPGPAGVPGSPGAPGAAGATGPAGVPGAQGILLLFEGESGEDGSPGAPGAPASVGGNPDPIAAAILADGPVGFWKGDDASGGFADSSGHGYNLTNVTGTVAYNAGGIVPFAPPNLYALIGGTAFASGVNSVGLTSQLGLTYPLLDWSCEGICAVLAGGSARPFDLRPAGNAETAAGVYYSGSTLELYYPGNSDTLSVPYAPANLEPFHWCVTCSTTAGVSTLRIYVNGIFLGSATAAASTLTGTMVVNIGGYPGSSSSTGPFYTAYTAIFGYALTAAQVAAHANAGPPGGAYTPANPAALVGLAAVNGTAPTYMRSDGAPALDQSIAPTWVGAHTFQLSITVGGIPVTGDIHSYVNNTSTVSGDVARVILGAGSTQFAIYAANQNQAAAIVTGGPTGPQGTIRTLGAYPIVFGTNNVYRGQVDQNGAWTLAAATSGDTLTVGGTLVTAGNLTVGGANIYTNNVSLKNAIEDDNDGWLRLNQSKAYANGIYTPGPLRVDGTTLIADLSGARFTAGYLESPLVALTSNHTLALADSGKTFQPTTTSLTLTIPANASIAFPVGTTINLICDADGCTIAITTDVLAWYKGGSSATGSRTIAPYSAITLYKRASTYWTIFGNGIS